MYSVAAAATIRQENDYEITQLTRLKNYMYDQQKQNAHSSSSLLFRLRGRTKENVESLDFKAGPRNT